MFFRDEKKITLYHAALLAVVCLHNKVDVLENLQKVAEGMTAESHLRKIASDITKGIRVTLVGLQRDEVYPLLYTTRFPISPKDTLQNFVTRWEYQSRQEPTDSTEHLIWETEQKLGPIQIRGNGLGYSAIDKWRSHAKRTKTPRAKNYFAVCGDVNNPDSETGSRTAHNQKIITTGCLPLIFNNLVYGLLYIHCKKRHIFTETELEALETFATQAAIAIYKSRLGGPSYQELYGTDLLDTLAGNE